MRSFPDDLPWQERAGVIDDNMIAKVDLGQVDSQLPLYSTRSQLKSLKKNMARAIIPQMHGARVPVRKSLDSGNFEAVRREWKLRRNFIPKDLFRDVLRRLNFCEFFVNERGLVVNDRDKGCPIARRFHNCVNGLVAFKHLVPKCFVVNTFGTWRGQLEPQVMDQIVESYRRDLEAAGCLEQLSPEEQNYLIVQGVRTMRTHGTKPNIDGDIRLIALACAVPAEEVVVYSRDRDLEALAIFATRMLPLENSVEVRAAA